MFRIDDELKELVESGVAVVLGTASPALRPNVVYAWGPRVLDDRTSMHLFLEKPRAEPSLSNLESTRRIAVTIADPVSYRSVQFKGRYIGSGEPTENEKAWVRRHREAFASTMALIGDPREAIENAWMSGDLMRLDWTVEAAFDQTPGPEAGQPL